MTAYLAKLNGKEVVVIADCIATALDKLEEKAETIEQSSNSNIEVGYEIVKHSSLEVIK